MGTHFRVEIGVLLNSCFSSVLLNSGEFGQYRKKHNNSLIGILRCFQISGFGSRKSLVVD